MGKYPLRFMAGGVLTIGSVTAVIAGTARVSAVRPDAAAVVRVVGHDCHPGIRQGSGFVAAAGVVVTDAHVIAGEKDTAVQVGGRDYPATPVLFNPTTDLAVLTTSAPLPAPLPLGGPARAGERGTLIGYPVHQGQYIGRASVEGTTVITQADIRGESFAVPRSFYVVHAFGQKGDSGGPVVANGRVLGVFVLYWPSHNTGYILPASTISRTLASAGSEPVSTGICTPA